VHALKSTPIHAFDDHVDEEVGFLLIAASQSAGHSSACLMLIVRRCFQ